MMNGESLPLQCPILVTGGSGFIGGRLLDRLAREGVQVLAPSSAELDVRNFDAVLDYLRETRPATVFHLAGSVSGRGGPLEPREIQRVVATNVLGSTNVLAACAQTPSTRLILPGTGDEKSTAPPSLYAASKIAVTLLQQAVSRGTQLRPTTLRLFAVYGPGQPAHFFVPQLIEAARTGATLAMTSGHQQRDFIWLDDVVEVMLRVARCEGARGLILDVCSGLSHSLREAVDIVSRLAGRDDLASFGELSYRASEPHALVGDPLPLRALVGDWVTTSLEEGLARLLRD